MSDTRNLAQSLPHFSNDSDLEEGHSAKQCSQTTKQNATEVWSWRGPEDKRCLGFKVQIAPGMENRISIFLIPDIPGSIGRGCFIFKINKFF